jgi:outer membrane lipoprotein carrier protein
MIENFMTVPTIFRTFSLATTLLLSPVWALSGGLQLLDQFLKSSQSGRAQFTQVITSPAKTDDQGKTTQKTKTSYGQFAFLRPHHFLFEYKKPQAQTLLADGQLLWTIDFDLGQATSRSQSGVLASTPVALIATASNRTALEKEFVLQEAPATSDGLQWVQATPKAKDSALSAIRIGLRAAGNQVELAALDMTDAFGQQSKMQFSQFEFNPALDKSLFKAKLPAGMEVSRQ